MPRFRLSTSGREAWWWRDSEGATLTDTAMPSFPGSDLNARRRVISVFITQGVAGLAVMIFFTWLRWDQTRIILDQLGPNAPALIVIAAAFTLAMALLKFELTNEIFVSLVITAAI